MKKSLCIIVCSLASIFASAQSNITKDTRTHRDSLLFEHLQIFRRQLRDPVFRLYPTENMHTFLELNTLTGQIWIVQWSLSDENRFRYVLDTNERIYPGDEHICGRFELYPTTNMYNFILLDNINGRCWQVQWSFDANKRFVIPIY